MHFKTARLAVRDWLEDLTGPSRPELDRAVAAMLTPPVLVHLAPDAQDMSRGVAGWIERQAGLAQGLTLRLVETQEIIGIGLLVREGADIHVGYLLAERHWGRGYATEMLIGLVDALRTMAPVTLRAGVSPDNPTSARVLEKAGFALDTAQDDPKTCRFMLRLSS